MAVKKGQFAGSNHPMFGRHHSAESKAKMRLAKLGKKASEATRLKMRLSSAHHRLGARHTPESNQKNREAHLGKKLTEEHKKTISESMKGMPGHPTSEETKNLLRQYRLKQKLPLKDTKIERLIQEELSSREYGYYCHYPIRGQPDITFPDKKIAIFLDGCYWHNCKKCGFENARIGREVQDQNVTSILQRKGWLVLRYWEHEIMGSPEQVVDEIEDILFSAAF